MCGRQVRNLTDGTRIVSGSEDNLVEIWDTATGAEVSSHARALGEAWHWIGFPGEGKLRFQALTRSESLVVCRGTR